jgi:glycosyltransferase involved in cell wall biosynthesis
MEATVVHSADALVFVNRHTADRVMRKYPDEYRAKAHVVPHGFDPAELESIAPAPRDDRLTLVYTGRFYDEIRTPEPLLRAIAALRERRQALDRELRVVFVGTPVASHRRLASALRLEKIVEFTGRRSFVESAGWVAAADVLLLIDAPAEENLFLPSKLVEYIPARKPILGLTPSCGASADLIRSLGYPVVPPDDERAIAAALEDLIATTRPHQAEPSPSHAVVARDYDIARTTAAFARVLDDCA